ncbi:MAG: hypothetical protein Tsb009_33980 [Planctomycetaceae bacterium]
MATDVRAFTRIKPRPEFARILKQDEAFASGGDDHSTGTQLNGWFDRLIVQSGWKAPAVVLPMLCLLSAVLLGGGLFVWREHFLLTGLASGIGAVIPVAALMIMRSRRQTRILKDLPEAIGELARAARTGRSLDQCLQLVAEDTKGPLGDELRLCHRRLQMGADMSTALQELPERTGVVSISVLVMALTVHQQTGGDLVKVLDRLSRTIRDRILFLGRLRAQTIASRATAILMLCLPPLILAFFLFRDPQYFERLTTSSWGQRTLIAAVVLQIIGSAWVLRILKTSRRT